MKIRHLAATALAAALLAGCGSTQAGAAAVIDGKAISSSQVGDLVNEVRTEIEALPKGAVAQVPAIVDLNAMVINRLILDEVVELAAAVMGVTASPADVAEFRDGIFAQYGKEKILAQIASQNGVSSAAVDEFFRAVLIERRIGQVLVPNGTADEQTQAMVLFLTETSRTMDISVSPRFGEWNPNNLQLAAGDNLLSLAAPVTQ